MSGVETSEHNVLIMGLPKTGKTTFLAVLWDVVDTETVEGSLILEFLEGDQQHLNSIRDLWANCREIPQTQFGTEKNVSMTLRDRQSNVKGRISFPDMDGEAFERQWTDRAWPRSQKETTEGCDSALVFIHPSKVKPGALIRDAKPLIDILTQGETDGAAPAESTAQHESAGPPPDSSQRFTPTQVQLVELLQFLRWAKQGLSGFRLGVIISAWDLVMKQGTTTPDKWLQAQLPLLDQFLVANREAICFRVYGVSAQGGDLEKDAVQLRKKHRPSERIIVVEGSSKSADITIPVRWVMGVTVE